MRIISKFTNLSLATVQKALKELNNNHFCRVMDNNRGSTKLLIINLEKLKSILERVTEEKDQFAKLLKSQMGG